MNRNTSNATKLQRMRSRLRGRLDDLLKQKPLPIRQERQAAPQVRMLESRFVLDASAALIGLDALSSGQEFESWEMQPDAAGSKGLPSRDPISESLNPSAGGFSLGDGRLPGALPVAGRDVFDLDLSDGITVSVTGTGHHASSIVNDPTSVELSGGPEESGSRGSLTTLERLANAVDLVEGDYPEYSSSFRSSEDSTRFEVNLDSQRATDLLEPEHSLEAWNQSPDSQHASEIVFVDSGVQDYETLVAGFRDGVEVLVIEGTQDGVSQIAKTLEGRANLDAIHLVSHGSVGSLQLGFTELSSDSMTQYADALSQIGSSLTDSGDLILYGCDVAQGEIGQAFISALATATDADVAASNDRTGDVGLSGDWVLESSSGDVGTAALIDETVTTGYAYVLAQPTVLSVEVSDTKITDSDDGSLFTVAVTFDQAMNTGGSFQPTLTFDPDVLLAGTMINPSAGAWSVGDTVFTKTFDVVDVGVEVTSIEIDVTGALNSPGLGGEAQADYTAEPEFDIDTLNPTVVVNIVESQLNDGDPSSLVTFEFSEGVTGFDANDLSAVGGSISDFAIVDTNTYTALFTASDGVAMTGSVTVTGGYEDQSGNAGVSGDDTVVIDRVSPTVMSVVRANADYTNAGTVDFTVTFSEDVAGVDVDGSDFRLVASVVDATIESVSGSNSVYTVTVSTGTTGGVIGLVLGTVPTIQDAAGNDLTNSTVSGVNQDYTIASTEVLLVDGDVFVADIREATADDLTLSVVGGDLVISSASGVIAAGMGVSRINDSSVSVALNDVTEAMGLR